MTASERPAPDASVNVPAPSSNDHGALDPQVDDLGYAACTIPLRVKGTPAHPDTSETNQAIFALIAEKPGVTEKIGEFYNSTDETLAKIGFAPNRTRLPAFQQAAE